MFHTGKAGDIREQRRSDKLRRLSRWQRRVFSTLSSCIFLLTRKNISIRQNLAIDGTEIYTLRGQNIISQDNVDLYKLYGDYVDVIKNARLLRLMTRKVV